MCLSTCRSLLRWHIGSCADPSSPKWDLLLKDVLNWARGWLHEDFAKVFFNQKLNAKCQSFVQRVSWSRLSEVDFVQLISFLVIFNLLWSATSQVQIDTVFWWLKWSQRKHLFHFSCRTLPDGLRHSLRTCHYSDTTQDVFCFHLEHGWLNIQIKPPEKKKSPVFKRTQQSASSKSDLQTQKDNRTCI